MAKRATRSTGPGCVPRLGEGQAGGHRQLVVGGWRPGARRIGGLLVGVPGPDGRLIYRGRVGGGIGAAIDESAARSWNRCGPPARRSPPGVPREDAGARSRITAGRGGGQVRPAHAGRPAGLPAGPAPAPGQAARGGRRCRLTGSRFEVEGRSLELSNLDKVLSPAGGFHQGRGHRLLHPDRPGVLPHLRDRALTRDPLSPTASTDGSFFEKNAPDRDPRLGTHREPARPRVEQRAGDHRLRGLRRAAHARVAGQPGRAGAAHSAVERSARPPRTMNGGRPGPGRPRPRSSPVLPGGPADARPAGFRRHRGAFPKTSGKEGHALLLPDRRHAGRRLVSDYAQRSRRELEGEGDTRS